MRVRVLCHRLADNEGKSSAIPVAYFEMWQGRAPWPHSQRSATLAPPGVLVSTIARPGTSLVVW